MVAQSTFQLIYSTEDSRWMQHFKQLRIADFNLLAPQVSSATEGETSLVSSALAFSRMATFSTALHIKSQ